MTAAAPGQLSLDRLLDASPALSGRLEGLRRAALTDAPILILGESGSGRSTLARAIHRASARSDGPLIEVEPGTIPSSLFASELFGHLAGAFTGADAAVRGRVERAAGGTLVLDRVEELPLGVQPKLLRLLAEHRYQPLGGDEREADVRFVAVGSDELPLRVERGAFRGDLYYRLEVVAFHLPPLRRRRDELAGLVDALLAELSRRLEREPPRLTAAALAWMKEHSWPGNLRELRNTLERSLVMAGPGDPLDPPPPAQLTGRRPRTLKEMEAEEIRKALAYTRGHQGRAAAILGVSRKALWEKRKRFGIP